MGRDLCNSATGRCESPPDAGTDAGAVVDAGTPDAGVPDAGVPDAGIPDAGPPDAGRVDAGFDAGLAVDAGCSSDLDCNGVLHCDPVARDCVECVISSHCLASTAPACDVRFNVCVGCVSNADCANPTPVCDQAQCLPCNTSAECLAGRECSAATFECVSLNETCSTARLILPGGTGSLSISAEPGQGLDDVPAACGSAGPELVYTFTTTSPQNLVATATPALNSTARPSLSLRAGCTGALQGCDAPASGSATLSVNSLPAGTYFLFLEGQGGASGRVGLSVSLQPPTGGAPTNDTCAAATSLTVNGTTRLLSTAVGTTTPAMNESASEPSCSVTAQNGPDVFFTYTLAARANVTAVVRPLSGSSLNPVVSIRPTCTSGGEVACQAATAATAVQATVNGQAAGTYVIAVDSANGTSGAFQLELGALPPVDNDACPGATALTFTSGTATATGDTTFATNGNGGADQTPSCSNTARTSGRDLVYSYTLTQAQDVTLSVTPTGTSPTLEPVLSVRATTCSDATTTAERGCVSPQAPTPARLSLVNQPAGTYLVWVDSSRDSTGPFQLEVQLAAPTPPPANDSCSAPQALTFTNGVASFSGSTAQAANDNFPGDVSPTCSPSARQNGRDVVFSFTLAQPQDVGLSVAPASGSTLVPAVYVRKNSCTSQVLSDEVVCQATIGTVTSRLTRLAAGTYFVFVDSSGNSSGAFTGSVTVSAPTPAPANDGCSGAQVLSFTNGVATVSGSMVAAGNSNTPNDNAPACGTDFFPRRFGRDLVYSYTLTQAQDVDVTVTPSNGGLVPVVYVRAPGQCSSFSAGFELTCVAQSESRPVRAYLPNQAAGTYFLFVDSNSLAAGDFSLAVTVRAPTSPPTNDSCTAPVVVTQGATGVMGDTSAATNTYSSLNLSAACRGSTFLDARDVVFQFTPGATGTVTATVTPEAGFNPALLLLQPSCAATECVRRVDAAGVGVPESFAFPVTQGQTVFLVVDSASPEVPGAFGRFSLKVE
jgi:hypothetical protein